MKTSLKLLFSFVLCLIILGGIEGGIVSAAERKIATDFRDIPSDHWAKEYIKKAVEAGYINGYEDKSFRPDQSITEEEFLAMIVKALKIATSNNPDKLNWFAPYYEASIKAGLYASDYTKDWGSPISRGDMAQTIVKATDSLVIKNVKSLGKKMIVDPYYEEQLDIYENLPDFEGTLQPIFNMTDVDSIIYQLTQYLQSQTTKRSGYYEVDRYLSKLLTVYYEVYSFYQDISYERRIFESTKRGLLVGMDNSELQLNHTVTRAQAVVAIERVLAFNENKTLPVDKRAKSQAEVLWHKTNLFTMWEDYMKNTWDQNAEKSIGYYIDPEYRFKSDFRLSTGDESYIAEVTGIYVIDMEDPNDPYLPLLPTTMDKLFWRQANKIFPIEDYPKSYLVYYPQVVLKNEYDPSHPFLNQGAINLNLDGPATSPSIYVPEEMDRVLRERNGSLELWEHVGYKTGEGPDKNAYIKIYPKATFTRKMVEIDLSLGIAFQSSNPNELFRMVKVKDIAYNEDPEIPIELN